MYISYAQCREDIYLLRAVAHIHHEKGFYIDVGANDPVNDSVTKVFYDHGWHGINVEASPTWFERLCRERPRDINIHAAATDYEGEVTFHDHADGGLGTTVDDIADMHRVDERVSPMQKMSVKATTLTKICEQHAPPDIHFLKIDVEGAEGAVLRGMDFTRWKPWVLCIECHMPLRPNIQMYDEWDSYVVQAGYAFVFTDQINRYYVSNDHPELFAKFAVPVDDFIPVNLQWEIDRLRQENEQLKSDLSRLKRESGASQES